MKVALFQYRQSIWRTCPLMSAESSRVIRMFACQYEVVLFLQLCDVRRGSCGTSHAAANRRGTFQGADTRMPLLVRMFYLCEETLVYLAVVWPFSLLLASAKLGGRERVTTTGVDAGLVAGPSEEAPEPVEVGDLAVVAWTSVSKTQSPNGNRISNLEKLMTAVSNRSVQD